MQVPHVVVIERSDVKYALDELPERLSRPPRSTPELDTLRSQMDMYLVDEVFVAGDGVLGINATRELFSGSIASDVVPLALSLNLCVAVPSVKSVETRGFETEDFQIFCKGQKDYASAQMIAELVRFLDEIVKPKGKKADITLAKRGEDLDYPKTFIRGTWNYDENCWDVEHGQARQKNLYHYRTESSDEVVRLLPRWFTHDKDVAAQANWTL